MPVTSPHRRRRLVVAVVSLAATAGLALSGCSASDTSSNTSSGSATGSDTGAELTMWTRAGTKSQSQALVKAYNETHKNQISLTIIPDDNYQAKVGSSAGSGSLPDLFSSDIVYLPNYTSKGLFADLTERIDALPYADQLNKAQIQAGTYEGKKYVLPSVVDASVMFYNKDLFTQAGLDANTPPTTLAEWVADAEKISALEEPGVSGTYFGGNCPGCMAFTMWPSIWASGGSVMNDAGTKATFDTDEAKDVFASYRDLAKVAGSGTKDETGATWTAPFPDGKVGLMPMPGSTLGTMPENTGVSGIPGVDGGESSFVGGDAIGIAQSSKNQDAAWNYLQWTETKAAQVDIIAKIGGLVTRADFADNSYSSADPRVVKINELVAQGQTPSALNYGAAFNDPNGPWLTLFRDQVFGSAADLSTDNDAITAKLTN
jgi:multiple sugar transport system substrate-binding protein